MVTDEFQWTEIYAELANKLLEYKNNRVALLAVMKSVYEEVEMNYPFIDRSSGIDKPLDDVCPFTIFGTFNKGITNKNKTLILKKLKEKLNLKSEVPESFDGVPLMNNMATWFFGSENDRQPMDISNLWDFYETAIHLADITNGTTDADFIKRFDQVSRQHKIKFNITMGLFWIRPYYYVSLDQRNRQFFSQRPGIKEDIFLDRNPNHLPDGEAYLLICSRFREALSQRATDLTSFPEMSIEAWKDFEHGVKESAVSYEEKGKPAEPSYWLYAPGEESFKWGEFYREGIMGIGWEGIGNLGQYQSKDEIKKALQVHYDASRNYMNIGHGLWQFANEIKPGDIIFVKKGRQTIIGRGIVESDYEYVGNRSDYNHIHKVNWTEKGEWDHPGGQAALKTLTDVSDYPDYVTELNRLFTDEDEDDLEPVETTYEVYGKNDFLNDVFMDETQYERLKKLLIMKQNIILQGAPGVGKTYAAKRLAYSIMGSKDTSRVRMVQFHQSYSYEDFIMGYKPSENNFELQYGPFYHFCKEAEKDSEKPYFFIIDEINRGNLSKIFGELLMLIEKDKRGEKIRLLYANELFHVPANVYIIGMMNTADRSLAMIDYALRRRFAFYELKPAFQSAGFQKYIETKAEDKFSELVNLVEALNQEIREDDSLGHGFVIGHSFLYTKEPVDQSFRESVVEYELIPLLEEYWFDAPVIVERWANKLRSVIS